MNKRFKQLTHQLSHKLADECNNIQQHVKKCKSSVVTQIRRATTVHVHDSTDAACQQGQEDQGQEDAQHRHDHSSNGLDNASNV